MAAEQRSRAIFTLSLAEKQRMLWQADESCRFTSSFTECFSSKLSLKETLSFRVCPSSPELVVEYMVEKLGEELRQRLGAGALPALEVLEEILHQDDIGGLQVFTDGRWRSTAHTPKRVLRLHGFKKDFKEKHPNVKQVAIVGKAVGEQWKSMSDANR